MKTLTILLMAGCVGAAAVLFIRCSFAFGWFMCGCAFTSYVFWCLREEEA